MVNNININNKINKLNSQEVILNIPSIIGKKNKISMSKTKNKIIKKKKCTEKREV